MSVNLGGSLSGTSSLAESEAAQTDALLLQNISFYGQDTCRITPIYSDVWLARKSRHNFWADQKRSTKTAGCYLSAQRAMMGAVLAALRRMVTEIDDVAPVHSCTYRKVVSAAGVLRADRMPLFVKKFSSDSRFQQGPRRRSGESLQNGHDRT